MAENKNRLQALHKEEASYEFSKFTRADALSLGLSILEKAKAYSDPIAVEITINGLAVFRYFMEGALPDSELWLERKRNSVNLMHMSSLRFLYWLEDTGASLSERKLNENDYAAGGGGFPIKIKGMDVIGSICVSGLPNHLDDHQLIIDSLKEMFK